MRHKNTFYFIQIIWKINYYLQIEIVYYKIKNKYELIYRYIRIYLKSK